MDTCNRALALIRLTVVTVPDFVRILHTLQYCTHTYRKANLIALREESTEVGLPAFDEVWEPETAHLCCMEKVIDIADVNHAPRGKELTTSPFFLPSVCWCIREDYAS